MRRRPSQPRKAVPQAPRPRSAEERAAELILRLETSGPNAVRAAEELDRLQAALLRADRLQPLGDRVAELAAAWADGPLRGERARAWLVLIGAFGLTRHARRALELATDASLAAVIRVPACRVAARLGGTVATPSLLEICRSRSEPAVRIAAVEALAELRDPTAQPALQALLEEDLPKPLWLAVAAAIQH